MSPTQKRFFLLTLGSFTLAAAIPCAAATITVDGRGSAAHTEIQAAIDAAADGDTVLVAPGEYLITRPIDFNRSRDPDGAGGPPPKNITVKAVEGPETTIIRMADEPADPDHAAVVVFLNGEGPASVLEGFTLTGGKSLSTRVPRGGGVYCQSSSPNVIHCNITGNSAVFGGGIYCLGSVTTFIDCRITGNAAISEGGGLFSKDAAWQLQSHPVLIRCAIDGNSAQQGGGVMCRTSALPSLRKCRITRNRAVQGGGFMTTDSSYARLTSCLIAGNASDGGAGVSCQDQSYPYFRNCTITENFARRAGGGVLLHGAYPLFTNSIIWGNPGGSLATDEGVEPRLTLCCLEAPTPPGSRSINRDPLFARPGAWSDNGTQDPSDDTWIEGDYRLGPSSPAIDVGTVKPEPGSGDEPAPDDIEGNSRPCWKDVDMGAYEYCGGQIPGLPEIIFVARDFQSAPTVDDTAVRRARSGRLLRWHPHGAITTLVDAARPEAAQGTPVDVMDPEVSFDASRIVFSGFSVEDGAWRIFEVHADGTGLRRITRTDRQSDLSRYGDSAPNFETYDDLDPCYLPSGKICFVSTRYPESAPEGRLRATNLYVVNPDGTDVHRITSERFGADTPAVSPATGQVVFSRWWRTPEVRSGSGVVNPDLPPEKPGEPPPPPPPAVPPGSPEYGNQVEVPPPEDDVKPGVMPPLSHFRTAVLEGVEESAFPGVNSWFLAAVHPDGSGLAMFSGFHLDRAATQAYRPSFHPSGEVLGLFLTETPFLGKPGRFGLRRYRQGPKFPTALGGPQTFAEKDGASFRYSSAVAMPDGRILVSGSRAGADPRGFDIFLQENSRTEPLFLFGEPDLAELDAVPLTPRPVPPVLETGEPVRFLENAPRDVDEAKKEGGTFTFQVENLFANAAVDVALPNAPPIGKRLTIEFFMAPQRTSFLAADPPALIRAVEIPASGKVEVELPAGVPLFEVLRRPDGTIPVGRDGQVFHVGGLNYGLTGRKAVCVGCHAGHSMMSVPEDPAITNLAPSAVVTASSVRKEGDVSFRPVLLVDRRTDFFRSEWAAAKSDPQPSVRLAWSVPIHAREAVIYAPKNGSGVFGARTQRIREVTLRTFLEGELQESRRYPRVIQPGGTRLELAEEMAIDVLEVVIDSTSGSYEGGSAAALAEIEVIGKAAAGSTGDALYVRGDADCDAELNVTDALSILENLFLSTGPFCCEAAADLNADGLVNITDPIALLGFLFRQGPAPPHPFPDCGRAAKSELGCDGGSCR